MAETQGTSGFGTLLKMGDGAEPGPEIFTTIAEITNITGPGITLELIDATHMESPQAFREYIPSLLDGSEITFDLNYLPGDANQGGLRAAQLARAKKNFQIVWTDEDASTDGFSGYVTDFTPSSQIDDKLSASATIKITGPITRVEALGAAAEVETEPEVVTTTKASKK